MTDTNQEVMEAIAAVRAASENHGTKSTEFLNLAEKTEEVFQKQEKQSADLTAKIAAEEKKRLDLEEKIDGLQVEMARKTVSGEVNYKETPEYKALSLFASKGFENLDVEQKALLRSDSDTAGGYLTSTEMDNEIIRKITEISPVRQFARVRTIGKKTLEMPKREGILVATYEGENAEADDSVSNYGSQTVTTYALTVSVPFTYDMMLSSDFDMESEIGADVAEAFGQKEGNKFILGSGSKEPEGILANASIVAGAVETAASGVIAGDDIIGLTGELKTGYNPIFAFNRQTLATLRTLKGSNGQYLWNVGLGGDAPNVLAGERYAVMQDVPSVATGTLSVVYGDFARGYTIVDRTGLAVIRDDVTQKKFRIIELCFHKYNTGQVVLPEAFKALKIKA